MRKINVRYRCGVCGLEIRLTMAPDEDPPPPKHCLEDMDLVAPIFEKPGHRRTFTTAQCCPQPVDRQKGDLIRRSTRFGGRPEATEQQHQTDEHRGVGVVERRDDVARQDGEHAQHDEHQHEDGHPLRALVELLGSGRRVPSAGRHRRIVVVGLLGHRGGVGQAGLGALRGGSAADRLPLGGCHGATV